LKEQANARAALKRRWTSGRKRGRGQPAEEAPGQAAAVVEDDAATGQNLAIWNHSTF
jgi:hypothetical protein